MRFLFLLGIVVIFWVTVARAFAAEETLRICFLSLNNPYEYKISEEFFENKLASDRMPKIEVIEAVNFADYVEEAVAKLVVSGKRCHGLVISGHHRKNGFEGQRVVGLLNYVFLKKLRCNSNFREWFNQVNVLWLQGCATSSQDATKGSDVQTVESDLSFERVYAKLFPNAFYLGYSGSAPSKLAPVTIPYHIANLAISSKLDDPMKKLSKGSIDIYRKNTILLLRGKHPKIESAWRAIRQLRTRNKFGINNHTVRSFPPISRSVSMLNFMLDIDCDQDIKKRMSGFLQNEFSLAFYTNEIKQDLLQMQKAGPTYIPRKTWLIKQLLEKTRNPKIRMEKRLDYLQLLAIVRPEEKLNKTEIDQLGDLIVQNFNLERKALDATEAKIARKFLAEAVVETQSITGVPLLVDSRMRKILKVESMQAILNALNKFPVKNGQSILRGIVMNDKVNGAVIHDVAWKLKIEQKLIQSEIVSYIKKHPKTLGKTIRLLSNIN